MSKEDIKRVPIPEDNVERFMTLILSMVEPCGIDQIPEIMHYVELLSQQVDYHVYSKKNKISPQKKVHEDRKRFIRIFKQRYRLAYDLEHSSRLTGADGKMINQANRFLIKEGFDCDEYLKWVFEEFLVDNPRFAPANIKQVCSNFVLHKFIVANDEVRKERYDDERRKKDLMALIGKGRAMARDAKDRGDEKFAERVTKVLKDFRDNNMVQEEFKKAIFALESEVE